MKKIYICVTACELRLLDAKKIYNYFLKNKHQIVYSPEEADIIFFITCGFTDKQSANILSKIQEFKKFKAELIVAGCLPEIEKENLSKIFDGKTINTKELDKIDELFPEHDVKFKDVDDANVPLEFLYGTTPSQKLKMNKHVEKIKDFFKKIHLLEHLYQKTRNHVYGNLFDLKALLSRFLENEPFYVVRVAWGCYCNCSYCAIKKAIGPLKMMP